MGKTIRNKIAGLLAAVSTCGFLMNGISKVSAENFLEVDPNTICMTDCIKQFSMKDLANNRFANRFVNRFGDTYDNILLCHIDWFVKNVFQENGENVRFGLSPVKDGKWMAVCSKDNGVTWRVPKVGEKTEELNGFIFLFDAESKQALMNSVSKVSAENLLEVSPDTRCIDCFKWLSIKDLAKEGLQNDRYIEIKPHMIGWFVENVLQKNGKNVQFGLSPVEDGKWMAVCDKCDKFGNYGMWRNPKVGGDFQALNGFIFLFDAESKQALEKMMEQMDANNNDVVKIARDKEKMMEQMDANNDAVKVALRDESEEIKSGNKFEFLSNLSNLSNTDIAALCVLWGSGIVSGLGLSAL